MLNRIALLLVALGLVVFASACGGGSGDVPDDAVAVVDGTEISRAELDELVARAKKAYEAQNQEFPKVGTPEYQNVQTQYVAFLVQREEFEKEAAELGLQVSEKDVDKEVQEFIKTRYDGNRKAAEKALDEQGFTFEAFEETIRTSLLAQKLFDAVTKDLEVEERGDRRVLPAEPADAVPDARDARGSAHPHLREERRRGRLPEEQGRSRAHLRAVDERWRFRGAGEGELRRSRLEGHRWEAHDHAGPDRARIRQDCIRAEGGGDLPADQDDVRLPRDRGALPGARVEDARLSPRPERRSRRRFSRRRRRRS